MNKQILTKYCEDKKKINKHDIDWLLVDSIFYLKKLVSFKSYSYHEKEITDYIEQTINNLNMIYLKTSSSKIKSFNIKRIENNILINIDFWKKDTLALVWHTDIVKEWNLENWKTDPFDLKLEVDDSTSKKNLLINKKLIWRWVSDMKWFNALMLALLKYSIYNEPKYNLQYIFYDKEEEWEKTGIETLIEKWELINFLNKTKLIIVWEGTNNKGHFEIHNWTYGFIWWTIKLNGKKSWHSSITNINNTVYNELNNLITILKKIQNKYSNKLKINLTQIEGDNWSLNTIPSIIQLWITIRFDSQNFSKTDIEKIIRQNLIENLNSNYSELKIFQSIEWWVCDPKIALDIIWETKTKIGHYWSDIAILNKIKPAINRWPWSIDQAHSYNEYIKISKYREFIEIITKVLFYY